MFKLYSLFIMGSIFLLFNCGDPAPIQVQSNENSDAVQDHSITISPKQFSSSGFETASLTQQSFPTQIEVSGIVHLPQKQHTSITSHIGGIVSKMNLVEGHWVKKGDLLFQLSNPELIDLQQQYLELKSHIRYLKNEKERQDKLSEAKISAHKNAVKAETEVEQIEAQYAGIQQKLSLYGIPIEEIKTHNIISKVSVLAPNSGFIQDLEVNNGMYLASRSTALNLVSNQGMHIELNVLEKDLSKIEKGQTVTFNLIGQPESLLAKVHIISNYVHESGMAIVHCEIHEKDLKTIKPGMYVQANIQVHKQSKIAVPKEAIVSLENKKFILIQSKEDSNIYNKIEVQVISSNDEYSAIEAESIPEDTKILSKGAYYMVAKE